MHALPVGCILAKQAGSWHDGLEEVGLSAGENKTKSGCSQAIISGTASKEATQVRAEVALVTPELPSCFYANGSSCKPCDFEGLQPLPACAVHVSCLMACLSNISQGTLASRWYIYELQCMPDDVSGVTS